MRKRGLVLLCLTTVAAGAAAVEDAPFGRMARRGNEPFWQLRINGATATYQRLGDAAIDLAGRATPFDYLPRPELVWRGRAAPLDGDLVAWITEERCLDTMSDREGSTEFSHRVRICMPGGEVLTGCCHRGLHAAAGAIDQGPLPVAELSAKATDDRSRLLLDLAPAIEARLGATPGPAPRVTC
jgi:uncharacterized membrane protein